MRAPPKNWTVLWKHNDVLQKRQTLFENPILFYKKLVNSIEKTPTAPSYKMLEAKNIFPTVLEFFCHPR